MSPARRMRACRKAGVELRFERCIGEDSPIDLIVSLNVQRRHMNQSHRALMAARLAPQLDRSMYGAENSSNLGNNLLDSTGVVVYDGS